MRDKIAEILTDCCQKAFSGEYDLEQLPFDFADKILALFPSLEGIEHIEKCTHCLNGYSFVNPNTAGVKFCSSTDCFNAWESVKCKHCEGGEIIRPAEWGEVMELVVYSLRKIDIETMGKMKREEVDKNNNIQFILKSGGRLRMKDG